MRESAPKSRSRLLGVQARSRLLAAASVVVIVVAGGIGYLALDRQRQHGAERELRQGGGADVSSRRGAGDLGGSCGQCVVR